PGPREMLAGRDQGLLVGEALRHVADHGEAVTIGRGLEGTDARDVEAVVGLDAVEAARGDPGHYRLGVLRPLEDDRVLPPRGGAADERAAREQPGARTAAGAEG